MISGWLISILSLVFTVLCVLLGVLINIVRKFTKVEDRQDELIRNVDRLVKDKDQTHNAMLEQMRFDREATNKRFRFIEERFMNGRYLDHAIRGQAQRGQL